MKKRTPKAPFKARQLHVQADGRRVWVRRVWVDAQGRTRFEFRKSRRARNWVIAVIHERLNKNAWSGSALAYITADETKPLPEVSITPGRFAKGR